MPPYVAANQRGFFHFALFQVNGSRSDIVSTPTMPVADPMSHVWTSSDRRIAAAGRLGRESGFKVVTENSGDF